MDPPDEPEAAPDLERWAAAARAESAAAERRTGHWSRRAGEAGATLAATLVDLAEGGRPLAVATTDGRSHSGTVEAVAQDFCALRLPSEALLLVALHAVAWCRPGPHQAAGPVEGGDRPLLAATLNGVLGDLAEDRRRVQLWAGGAEPLAGELRAAGGDVVTVRLDGSGSIAVAATAAVTEVLVVHDR